MIPLSQYRIRKQEMANAQLQDDEEAPAPVVRAWNPVQSTVVNAK